MLNLDINCVLMRLKFNNRHQQIGIVIFSFIFLMPAIGVAHHLGFKKSGRRSIISHIHIWLGRCLITLGMINGGLGMQLANSRRSSLAVYAVIAGIFWLMWMIAACFGEVRRMTTGRRNRGVNKGYISNGSSPRTGNHRTRDIDDPAVASGGTTTHVPATKQETYA
jgi:hypothetical protein